MALRFSETRRTGEHLEGSEVGDADLIFPSPVSWCELRLHVEDPNRRVAALGMLLDLNLDPPGQRSERLADLGASRTVYAALTAKDQVELIGRPAGVETDRAGQWPVDPVGSLRPFDVGTGIGIERRAGHT